MHRRDLVVKLNLWLSCNFGFDVGFSIRKL